MALLLCEPVTETAAVVERWRQLESEFPRLRSESTEPSPVPVVSVGVADPRVEKKVADHRIGAVADDGVNWALARRRSDPAHAEHTANCVFPLPAFLPRGRCRVVARVRPREDLVALD